MILARCVDSLVRKLIASDIIQEEKAGLYAFGFEQGFRSALEICLMLLTGLFMGFFWQSVVILLSFMPIRVFAGGYHAKTPVQCLIKSWLLFFGALLWIKFLPLYLFIQIIVIGIAGICLWCFCPVQDEHKPLEDYEIVKYRKKAFFFFGMEVILFVTGYVLGVREFSGCLVLGMVMVLVVLVAGIVKNKRKID